ncbi:DNA repair protein RecO [Plebeiibacterium marinum]|uniref:DNA repair protein RecO n=1 Tax=Plebeiibacterium marinum TaxID=2992111 RepID=A0AAE3SMI2_9BACT|nr:DNA repair protein RecO [Plebeiobacterium marinum]MCW3807580.1 DNA repair protein RecO [Plebeiobacterium marinum]
MIESTRGIVLTHTKYAESSIISHIYTEHYGLQSYMINQVRSRKSKGKTVFLQPLTLVNLEVYHSDKKTIHRIKDFKVSSPFSLIPFEPIRQSLAFFIAEVLNKALKHEDKLGNDLFDFLFHSICLMDDNIPGIQNFHLFLLFKLTQPLGFYPNFEEELEKVFFDLRKGMFTIHEPVHPNYMNVWQSKLLYKLKSVDVNHLDQIELNGEQRTEFIEKMLDYYHLHLSGFSNIKSFKVLKDLFR